MTWQNETYSLITNLSSYWNEMSGMNNAEMELELSWSFSIDYLLNWHPMSFRESSIASTYHIVSLTEIGL